MTPSLNNMTESITMDELMAVLKNLKSNKAPGEDVINLELFKYVSQEFLTRLLRFINILWDEAEPPEDWKKAIVIPIYKKKEIAKIVKTIEELVC
jgi:hypothetical protein